MVITVSGTQEKEIRFTSKHIGSAARGSVALSIVVSMASLLLSTMPTIGEASIIAVSWSPTNSRVYGIDETTGVGELIGLSGFPRLNALAADGSGTLYSTVDYGTFGAGDELITIDPNTGAGTSIATLDFGSIDPALRGLAFRPSDGVLFAVNNTGNDELFTIDIGTGVGTLIADQGTTGLQGIDFASDGTLYGWDNFLGLVTVDTTTGLLTDVNPTVGATAAIQSVVFGPDGTLYGARNALYTIDVGTGVTTIVGSGGYADVRGIAFLVPEPTMLALMGLGFGGLVFSRRRSLAA